MKELSQIRMAVLDALRGAGIQAMEVFPEKQAMAYSGVVAAVGVGAASGKTAGFCHYLGEMKDPETQAVRERYGKELFGQITVERMARDYGCRPEDVLAGIGPSIGACCFEVDEPVAAVFAAMEEGKHSVRERGAGKYDVDLWEVNRRILLEAGIKPDHISVAGLCTRCHPDVFWSHRAVGAIRGSLAAFIAIADR